MATPGQTEKNADAALLSANEDVTNPRPPEYNSVFGKQYAPVDASGMQAAPPGYTPAPQYPYNYVVYPAPNMTQGVIPPQNPSQHAYPMPPQVIMRSPGVVTQPYVNDHMAMSVVSTLLCCWLIGIFAILKSLKVREDLMRGDVDGAQRSSADAYRLSKWAIAVGVIFSVVSFVIIFVIFFQRWSYMY